MSQPVQRQPDQVRAACRQAIAEAGPGISWAPPPKPTTVALENLLAMHQVAHEVR